MIIGLMMCWLQAGWVVVTLLCVCYTLITFTAEREDPQLPVNGKSVLITGCDTGFGHSLAKFLDKAGVKVYAGVLNESGPGAEELRRYSSSLTVLQLDVTDTKQIAEALQLIKNQEKTGLWGLVNNAGVVGYLCEGEILPMRMLNKILNVNFIAGVEVTQAFLPLIRKAKGRLVNIASVAGSVPFSGFAAYGASKAAVINYSSTLRQELSPWGIKVAIVQPGHFKTNVLGNEEHWNKVQEEILGNLPQEVIEAYGEEHICSLQQFSRYLSTVGSSDFSPVVKDIKHALLSERPRDFYYPGQASWALSFIYSFCPTSLYNVFVSTLFKFPPPGSSFKK
ncbi:estradiol 17-beta-dehydrogenase 2 isoform X2 [Hoplias malabaricus]|uniref:estradiol 17-beta-dehydrogenase 2 isoform X2 n=1 Tax=Hoplias malabaricus TaxID=27720 RepID=UPI003461F7C8